MPWGLFSVEVLNNEEVIIVGGYTANPVEHELSLNSVYTFNVFTGWYQTLISLSPPKLID